MMKWDAFKCLSFDCYGTLIDWESGLIASLRPVLASHSIECDSEQLLVLYGQAESRAESGEYRSYRSVLEDVLGLIGQQLGFQPNRAERQAFAESLKDWPVFPDTCKALQALSKRYALVVLSNVDDDLFEATQKQLGVQFHEVLTAQKIGSYKPDSRNFQHLVDTVGFSKGEIVHVAQSLFHDIGPAKSLGLSTVWVNRRQGREGIGATPLSEAVPDFTVPSMEELVRQVESQSR